jgi:hypothetical protein
MKSVAPGAKTIPSDVLADALLLPRAAKLRKTTLFGATSINASRPSQFMDPQLGETPLFATRKRLRGSRRRLQVRRPGGPRSRYGIFGQTWKQASGDGVTIYGQRNRFHTIPLTRRAR